MDKTYISQERKMLLVVLGARAVLKEISGQGLAPGLDWEHLSSAGENAISHW